MSISKILKSLDKSWEREEILTKIRNGLSTDEIVNEFIEKNEWKIKELNTLLRPEDIDLLNQVEQLSTCEAKLVNNINNLNYSRNIVDNQKMNEEKNNYNFIFHATEGSKEYLSQIIKKNNLENVDLISNENIKIATIKKSIFAIVKSGTVSLEVCKYGVPSIIIYKMNFLNFFIAKLFLKIKYANMINIINNKEIIPELLQKECNSDEIYKTVNYLLKKPEIINEQLKQVNKTIKELRSKTSSSNEASNILLSYLR